MVIEAGMNRLMSNPRFTHFWLPFGLAIIAVVIAFWVQDIPVFRRNALLLALLVGLGFFHPMLRHWLLILFCYGFGFYVWTKIFLDIDTWATMSHWARLQTVLWAPIGLLCILAAMGMAVASYKRQATSFLFTALTIYFVGYTYEEVALKHWMQALAGLGFTLIGLVFAVLNWVEGKQGDSSTEHRQMTIGNHDSERVTFYTGLPLQLHARGKVRDTYQVGDSLLMIATDRLSAFDVVLPTPIPGKGWVLTQISRFWFERTPWMPNHLISTEWEVIAGAMEREGGVDADLFRSQVEGRAMLVKKAEPFPVECVVRGYIAGSLWKEYLAAGGFEREVVLHGIRLPAGMQQAEQLPEPIFTPATKADTGHDENISYERMCEIIGEENAGRLREYSLKLYREAAEYALSQGVIIADTKFEFGKVGGEITLIDEVLTPDSSRFWDASLYKPGKPQPSFDKQFVRDYLETLDWDKTAPGPELPPDIVSKTVEKYREAYRRLVESAV